MINDTNNEEFNIFSSNNSDYTENRNNRNYDIYDIYIDDDDGYYKDDGCKNTNEISNVANYVKDKNYSDDEYNICANKDRFEDITSTLNDKCTEDDECDINTIIPMSPYMNSERRTDVKHIKILCIDGGGFRSKAAMPIITKLQQLTGGKKLSECFDLIVGTSAGAIIAAAIACDIPYDRVFSKSDELIESIAKQKNFVTDIINKLMFGSSWNCDGIEMCLENLFDGKRMGDLYKNKNVALICACADKAPQTPYVIRSYKTNNKNTRGFDGIYDPNIYVADAIRASIAAPTFFDPVYVNNRRLVDGGIVANNPSLVALTEAEVLWPGCHVDALVSIGYGQLERLYCCPSSVKGWLNSIIHNATGTCLEHVHCMHLLGQDRYFRLEPDNVGIIDTWETDPIILQKMVDDCSSWVHKNNTLFKKVAKIISDI